MVTLTIDLEDDVVAGLERVAADRHIGLKEHVEAESSASIVREANRQRFVRLVKTAPLQLEPGWTWNREDCYDRPQLRGYKRPPVLSDGPLG